MRSLLLNRWDGSRRRSWMLVVVTALVGITCGLLLHHALSSAPRPTGAPVPSDSELSLATSSRPGLRVLFIGNSFTAANAMVSTVRRLAVVDHAGSRRIFTVVYDPGGSTLHDAANNPQLRQLLGRVHWDVVVMQEQSQLPALSYWLTHQTLPSVHVLQGLVRRAGAWPLLFETWGYEHGDLMNFGSDTYTAMQGRLRAGYALLSRSEGVTIAPVGDAWARALHERPAIPLWSVDGKHPSVDGSYLAAAEIAATIERHYRSSSPQLTSATTPGAVGPDAGTAAWLRGVALEVAHTGAS